MKTVNEHIRSRIMRNLGVTPQPSYEELVERNWSAEFVQLMRNRMILGGLRYGIMGDTNKPDYDRIASILHRLGEFERKGNLEHLVDVANLAMCEFVEGRHPLRHWAPGDDGYHTQTK